MPHRVEGVTGPYRTCDFSKANLLRKYGPEWEGVFAETAHRRLRAWGPDQVYRAASRYCVVVSLNLYRHTVCKDLPEGCEDKPVIIGEFRFGAMDRGAFHTGLGIANDPTERAALYKDYLRSALAHPRCVGTRRFQWCDQPLTGRGDRVEATCWPCARLTLLRACAILRGAFEMRGNRMRIATSRRAFLEALAWASAAGVLPVRPGAAEARAGGVPFRHDYSQGLTYKIFCADKAYPDQNLVTFEDALRIMRVIHDVTGGLEQVVYLVGWQFDGHDSKYPSWAEVNPRLKRPQDPDARASFCWLAEEAKTLNAGVSVHINMSDAYETSPLWKEYRENGLIILGKDGQPRKAGVWGGEQSYLVDKVKEWRSGLAKTRIDALVALLPFLRESGSVHIDAFGLIGKNEELRQAVYGIFDYWRNMGIDVTTEYFDFELVGRLPMVYHLNLSEENRVKYPATVICGGGDGCNQRHAAKPSGWAQLPEAGCLYEEAWGVSIDHDLGASGAKGIVGKLCTRTLPWYFLNRHLALSYEDRAEDYHVTFSAGVETAVRKSDRHLTIHENGRVLVDGGDVFMPALWTKTGEWFVYSRGGGTRTWPAPDAWRGKTEVLAYALSDDGRSPATLMPLRDGNLTIQLDPGEAFALSVR